MQDTKKEIQEINKEDGQTKLLKQHHNDFIELDKLNKQMKRKVKKIPKKRCKLHNKNKTENVVSMLKIMGDNEECSKKLNRPIQKKVTKRKKRATMLDDMLILIDSEYISDRKHRYNPNMKCPSCNSNRKIIFSEGICVCTNLKCGKAESIVVDSDRPNYKDNVPEKSGYPYKRINHFNEWLSLFQAKESTEIPKYVYEDIIAELRKLRIKKKSISIDLMKKIMKGLRLNQYYEHIPHLISKITGTAPPTINRETEEKLRAMFREIQEPWMKHRPPDRINFFSYSYVLHKFCQLLELDKFIKRFPLLKSRDKLRQYDRIWKIICKELKWEFYPSV